MEIVGREPHGRQYRHQRGDGGRGDGVDPSVAALEPVGHISEQQHGAHCDETQLETHAIQGRRCEHENRQRRRGQGVQRNGPPVKNERGKHKSRHHRGTHHAGRQPREHGEQDDGPERDEQACLSHPHIVEWEQQPPDDQGDEPHMQAAQGQHMGHAGSRECLPGGFVNQVAVAQQHRHDKLSRHRR